MPIKLAFLALVVLSTCGCGADEPQQSDAGPLHGGDGDGDVIGDGDGDTNTRPSEILPQGAVTHAEMLAFFQAVRAAYPSDRAGFTQRFMVGSASHQWADEWLAVPVDWVQFPPLERRGSDR